MQAKYAFLLAIGGIALGAAGSSMMTSAHAQTGVPYYEVDEITVKDQAVTKVAASAKSARQPTPLAVTSLLVVTTNPKV